MEAILQQVEMGLLIALLYYGSMNEIFLNYFFHKIFNRRITFLQAN